MRQILSILTIYFLLVTQCFAATGVPNSQHWEYASFGGAGAFPMVISDNFTADKVYAIPDVNAPYVSTNKGELWSSLSTVGAVNSGFKPTQVAAFVQSKTTATLMYALDSTTTGGLSKSTDGGQTWTKLNSFRAGKGLKTIVIDKDNDNNVFVAPAGGIVYKSTDGGVNFTSLGSAFASRAASYTTQSTCVAAGASWSASGCSIGVTFIYHDSVNNDLYLGSKGFGMVKYDLGTDTQTYVDLAGTNALFNTGYDTYIDGSSVENLCIGAGFKVACTSDFSTWNYSAALASDSTYFINTLAVHRKADTTINIVANRQLKTSVYTNVTHYSTDNGATWGTSTRSNNTTMNPTGAYNAGNLVFYAEDDRTNDGVIYLTTDWRVYRSDNSGQTFHEKVDGAPMQVAHDIEVSPNGTIYMASMDKGIVYSTDKGDTWIMGTPSTAKGQPFVTSSVNDYGGHYWQIETAGTRAEWDAGNGKVFVCATMYSTPTSLFYVNYLLRSLDNGVTWTRSNSGLPTIRLFGDAVWGNGYCRAMGLSADESKLYIGMDGENGATVGGLFLSEDDGATFERVWSSPRKIFNALAIDPTVSNGLNLMFGTWGYNNYNNTYQSENAELTGSGQTRTGTLNHNNFIVSGTVTFTSSGETFTDNGNATLTSDLGGSGTYNTTTGAYSLTFISTPSTTTATYQWRGYVDTTNFVMDQAYDSSGRPYAVGNASGPVIYRSVQTSFGDGSGSYGTWQLMKKFGTNGILDGLAIDPRNNKRIFVSVTEGSDPSTRRVYVTTNANQHTNATWVDITGDLPIVGGCRDLEVTYFDGPQGHLLCASNGGGMWKLDLADEPQSFPKRTVFGGYN